MGQNRQFVQPCRPNDRSGPCTAEVINLASLAIGNWKYCLQRCFALIVNIIELYFSEFLLQPYSTRWHSWKHIVHSYYSTQQYTQCNNAHDTTMHTIIVFVMCE